MSEVNMKRWIHELFTCAALLQDISHVIQQLRHIHGSFNDQAQKRSVTCRASDLGEAGPFQTSGTAPKPSPLRNFIQ